MMRCCFDRRVWIGISVLAAGLFIADPRAGWVALPVLAGLACPVSMLVMMRGMRQGTGSAPETQTAGRLAPAALRRRIAPWRSPGCAAKSSSSRLLPAMSRSPRTTKPRSGADDLLRAYEPLRRIGHPPRVRLASFGR